MDDFDKGMRVFNDLRDRHRYETAIHSTPFGAQGDDNRIYTVEICASNMSGKELVAVLKMIDQEDLNLSIDIRGEDAWLVLS